MKFNRILREVLFVFPVMYVFWKSTLNGIIPNKLSSVISIIIALVVMGLDVHYHLVSFDFDDKNTR